MSQLLPRFAFLICLFLITFVSAAAQQSRWSYIGRAVNDSVWYLDKSFKKNKSGTVTSWEKVIFPDDSFSIEVTEWNCSERKKRMLQADNYAPSGDFLSHLGDPAQWRFVVPDSVEEKVFGIICGNSISKKRTSGREDDGNSSFAQTIKKSVLMSEANPNRKVIRKVAVGEKLTLVSEESTGVWYRVFDPKTNSEGWLNGNHFKIVKVSKPARNIGPNKRNKRKN